MNLGLNSRPKKTKQLSKEELLSLIEKHKNNKNAMAIDSGIRVWSIRHQIKKHNIEIDGRIISNKKRKVPIPEKSILKKLYSKDNLNLTEIGKIFKTSNVTVKKWFDIYDIPRLSHSESIKQKAHPKYKKLCIEKYGNPHFFASNSGKEKIASIFTEKYGVPYHPIGNTSKAEIEVLYYFNSLKQGFEKSYIFGIELDGYNRELNIAFEYCGLYWHRESRKGKNIHYRKYKICKENNIRLFTIFEDEWLQRKSQVQGFIRAALNCNTTIKYARKLQFFKLKGNDKNANNFLETYHIQGKPTNTISHYVLMENGEIITCITIGKHHRNEKEIVISRCCTKVDHSVTGGAKRLFKYICKDLPGTMIKTWSDNRWTEGYLYERLGFTMHSEKPVDYSYVSDTLLGRKSKQSMKKKNIGASKTQTEYQRALELGFDRIWDCGKKTWIIDV